MKILVYIGVICLCLVGFNACHTDYLDYDTSMKDGIYFTGDSLYFQFGLNKGEDIDYNIRVHLVGLPKDYDRSFSVEWIAEETTAKRGLHYDVSDTLMIPANQTSGTIAFVLHRYVDPALNEAPVIVKMKLRENEHFRVVMLDSCKFEFSDEEMPQPNWWQDIYFGPYSQMLMIDILNSYWDLEETHPTVFERIVEMYGREFEGGTEYGQFPYRQKVPFVKYVITPVYEYYQEHPHEGVDIPDPAVTIKY